MQTCDLEQLVPGRRLARIEVDERVRRLLDVCYLRGPRVQLDRAVVREPRQRGRAVDDEVQLAFTRVGRIVAPAVDPFGCVLGSLLLPKALLLDAVGEAVEIQRAICEVGEENRRDATRSSE